MNKLLVLRSRGFSNTKSAIRVDQLLAFTKNRMQMPKRTQVHLESFEEIPEIPLNLVQSLRSLGFTQPTPLQGALLGHFFASPRADLLCKAHPGAGKSVGYLIALLSRLQSDWTVPRTKHLILVPTEQLAVHLAHMVQAITSTNTTSSLITSTNTSNNANTPIVIAQPDPLRILMAQGQFDWRGLETIVVDEVDALVKPLKRYATDLQRKARAKHPVPTLQLLQELKDSFQTDPMRRGLSPRLLLTSATLNKRTRHDLCASVIISEKGKCISIDLPDRGQFSEAEAKGRFHHLLLKDASCVDELVGRVTQLLEGSTGRTLLLLPAEQSKSGLLSLMRERMAGRRKFGLLSDSGNESADVLIASDVDVRGLNVPQLSTVIILDLPRSAEHFIHMAGRVGRVFNPDGHVYTVLGTPADFQKYSSMLKQLDLVSTPQ